MSHLRNKYEQITLSYFYVLINIPLQDLFNELWLAERYATYGMLDSVLFELANVSHVTNIGQATAQHLSRDLIFVASDRMTQTFCREVQTFHAF